MTGMASPRSGRRGATLAGATGVLLVVSLGAANAGQAGEDSTDAATQYRATLSAAEAEGVYVKVESTAERSLDSRGSSKAPELVDGVVADVLATSRTDLIDLAAESRKVQVHVTRSADGSAFGVASVTAPLGVHTQPQGWFFVAADGPSGWQVALENEAEFAALVESSPALDEEQRAILTSYATAPVQLRETDEGSIAATGLGLPWSEGSSWTYLGGPHGFSALPDEPRSSLDLSAGGGGSVRAAGDGVAAAMCTSGGGAGWVRIAHASGFSTDYYHLIDNITPGGETISEGDFVGYEGQDITCGGSAGSPHVHFTLGQRGLDGSGSFIAIEGHEIGGWTFWNGAQQYEGSATHGGETAYVYDALHNYGGDGGGDPGDPPTDASVWSDGPVNLRSRTWHRLRHRRQRQRRTAGQASSAPPAAPWSTAWTARPISGTGWLTARGSPTASSGPARVSRSRKPADPRPGPSLMERPQVVNGEWAVAVRGDRVAAGPLLVQHPSVRHRRPSGERHADGRPADGDSDDREIVEVLGQSGERDVLRDPRPRGGRIDRQLSAGDVAVDRRLGHRLGGRCRRAVGGRGEVALAEEHPRPAHHDREQQQDDHREADHRDRDLPVVVHDPAGSPATAWPEPIHDRGVLAVDRDRRRAPRRTASGTHGSPTMTSTWTDHSRSRREARIGAAGDRQLVRRRARSRGPAARSTRRRTRDAAGIDAGRRLDVRAAGLARRQRSPRTRRSARRRR